MAVGTKVKEYQMLTFSQSAIYPELSAAANLPFGGGSGGGFDDKDATPVSHPRPGEVPGAEFHVRLRGEPSGRSRP